MAENDSPKPERIGGHEIVGRLGEGPRGVVHLGRESEESPQVVVKTLHVDPETDPGFAERLRNVTRVSSSYVARTIAAGVEDGRPYVIREHVEGRSLAEAVAADGPLSGDALDRVAVGMLTALTAVHVAGFAHRALTPSNVILTADGPRVTDVELGEPAGELGFRAPEQIAGLQYGPYADVFSWAATVVFAATGAAPFEHDKESVLNGEPEVGELPEPLRQVVVAALAKEVTGRPTAYVALLRLLGDANAPMPAPAIQGVPVPPPGTGDLAPTLLDGVPVPPRGGQPDSGPVPPPGGQAPLILPIQLSIEGAQVPQLPDGPMHPQGSAHPSGPMHPQGPMMQGPMMPGPMVPGPVAGPGPMGEGPMPPGAMPPGPMGEGPMPPAPMWGPPPMGEGPAPHGMPPVPMGPGAPMPGPMGPDGMGPDGMGPDRMGPGPDGVPPQHGAIVPPQMAPGQMAPGHQEAQMWGPPPMADQQHPPQHPPHLLHRQADSQPRKPFPIGLVAGVTAVVLLSGLGLWGASQYSDKVTFAPAAAASSSPSAGNAAAHGQGTAPATQPQTEVTAPWATTTPSPDDSGVGPMVLPSQDPTSAAEVPVLTTVPTPPPAVTQQPVPVPTVTVTPTKTRTPKSTPTAKPSQTAKAKPTATVTKTVEPTKKPTPTPTKTTKEPEQPQPTPTKTTQKPQPTKTTSPPKPNPYSATQVCGSGFVVQRSSSFSGGTTYQLWNNGTGQNCVVTLKSGANVGKSTPVSATLEVQGGASQTDSGNYEYYAGPVKLPAKGKCVRYSGSAGSGSTSAPWGNCG